MKRSSLRDVDVPIHGGAGVEMGVSLEFNYFKTCEATCKSEDRRE